VGTVQPSSLIFLLVIALWAAFLVQHWLGRREHLTTARTVDRFSESMRILDRAGAEPEASLERPASSAARVHRPQATVSRAESLLATVAESPTLGRARSAGAGAGDRLRAAQGRAVAGARRAGSAGARRAPVFGRSTRGVLVTGALVLTLITSAMALGGLIGIRFPLVSLALTIAAMWWLRRSVAAANAARRAGRGARPAASRPTAGSRPVEPVRRSNPRSGARPAARSGAVRAGGTTRHTQGAASAESSRATARAEEPAPVAVVESAPAAVGEKLYDLAAVEASEKQAAAEQLAREGWQPVPVPPPTYTMKAKAVYADAFDDEDDIASPYAEDVTDLTDYAAERARLASG